MAELEAIGTIVEVASDVLDVIGLVQDAIPPSSDSNTQTNVRVAVGLNGPNGLSDADGDIDVRIFNDIGQEVGPPSVDNYCNSGNTACDITITHDDDHNGQQGTYGLFTGNDNAICIAYTTITWPDDNKWGWTGDWASQGGDNCAMGQTWYYSNIIMQNGTSGTYKPNCIWLDADGDQPATAFQVHFPDFYAPDAALSNVQTTDPQSLCKNPSYYVSFGDDPNGITYYTDSKTYTNGDTSDTKKKRSNTASADDRTNPAKWIKSNETVHDCDEQGPPPPPTAGGKHTASANETRLVTSTDKSHLASELCNHPYSNGPDFVSIFEELFCDMHSKILYPLCPGSGSNSTANTTAPAYKPASTSGMASVPSSASTVTTAAPGSATGAPAAQGCFDMDSKKVLTGPGRLARRSGIDYTEVKEWN